MSGTVLRNYPPDRAAMPREEMPPVCNFPCFTCYLLDWLPWQPAITTQGSRITSSTNDIFISWPRYKCGCTPYFGGFVAILACFCPVTTICVKYLEQMNFLGRNCKMFLLHMGSVSLEPSVPWHLSSQTNSLRSSSSYIKQFYLLIITGWY